MSKLDYRQILLVAISATLAAGVGILFARLDMLWIFSPLTAAFCAGVAVIGALRARRINQDIHTLDTMIEGTRRHVTLLARHTRELHDAFSQTVSGWPMPQSGGSVSAEDFAVLSTLVRDLADSVSELHRKYEAAELSVEELRRLQDGAGGRTAAQSSGWVTAAKPSSAAQSPSSSIRAGHSAVVDLADADWRQGQAYHERDDHAQDRYAQERSRYTTASTHPVLPSYSSSAAAKEGQQPSRAVRQLVAAAIAADRFELYLQRIVSLPQRKIRGYEVMLRPEGAEHKLDNVTIRAAVESIGHQLMFDRRMMVQAVRLARAFVKRGRDVILFVDMSQRFLMSRDALDELSNLITETPGIASRIVFNLPNRFFRKVASFEREALRELSSLGFTFLARDVDLAEVDFEALSAGGVRWMRMAAADMMALSEREETPLGFVAADIATMMARQNITLIVDQVPDETTVAELLDMNVSLAQGVVFAPPQAVQKETFDAPHAANASARPQSKPEPDRRGLRDLARRTGA